MKLNKTKIISLSLCAIFALQTSLLSEETKSLGDVDIVENISNNTENTGLYTIDSMKTSTKLNLSLRNTPQSVTVLTSQKLQDLGITSYQDMLNSVSGVTINRWDERLYPMARGFDIDYYQLDGIPTHSISDSAADDMDLSIYDRVEVVKGANGLMTGAGSPSISLNFVRKRANSKELKGDVSVSAGSWSSYSAVADISTPLNSNGTIRGRLIAKKETKDSFMDSYKRENTILYGVVDMDLTDTTYLSLALQYQDLDRSGIRWGGLPAFYTDSTRTNFNRSKTVTEDWTYWNSETKSVFVDFKQELFNDISLNMSYSHRRLDSETYLLYFGGAVDKASGSGVGSVYEYINESYTVEDNLDTYISAPFEVAGLEHELILGYMYNRSNARYNNWGMVLPSSTLANNFMNFNNIDIANPNLPMSVSSKEKNTIQTGTYLVGKFSLMDNLKLIAGARLTNWKYTAKDAVGNKEFKNELTPYVGLVYDLDKNHSIYTSYTSIFKPQDYKKENGDYLDPVEGNSFEAGIKGEYLDGDLNASLSLFKIEQDNVGEVTTTFVSGTSDFAYKGVEGVTSKGFEIDVTGKITDDLSLDFGIANFEAEDASGVKYNTKSSRTTANIFAKYRMNDYSFAGGLKYKSKYYTGSGTTKIIQDAYTIANAMVAYKISKNANIQLNIENLFDKKYYSGIGTNSMVYGDPRNATLTFKYTF